MAQWHVPLLAEFCPDSCSSFPPATRKLATSPVGLPLKLSTSQAAKRYLRSGEKQIQSTVETLAATPAAASSPLKGFQSKERMPAGVPEATKTRLHVRCGEAFGCSGGESGGGSSHQKFTTGKISHGKSDCRRWTRDCANSAATKIQAHPAAPGWMRLRRNRDAMSARFSVRV